MTRRAGLVAVALLGWLTPGATAQQPTPHLLPLDPQTGFLSSARFHLGVEALSNSDVRFDWDGDFGGEVDVVDFGVGRASAAFNYEVLMGGVLQPFDPIHNNYTIGLLGAVRVRRAEIGLKFEHVSRHLGDRAKDFGIAWNTLGAEVAHRRRDGRLDWQVRARALAMVMRGAVDYDAEIGADAVVEYAWRPGTALVGAATVKVLTIDQRLSDRDAQVGARVEAGVRFPGNRAALELFAAAERRIDPDPLDLGARSWLAAGFRVVSR
jgi:hypothetical protein